MLQLITRCYEKIGHHGFSYGLFILSSLSIGSALAAGQPIPFDAYTVNNGAISTSCPTLTVGTVTCKPGVDDNGMLQREITVSGTGSVDGTYLQFIVTDPGVTGDAGAAPFSAARGSVNFSNEDFVKMNHRGDGISSRQTLISSNMLTPALEARFVNQFDYRFGWAQTGTDPWIHTTQDISQVDYSANPTSPTEVFSSAADITSSGNLFNSDLDIDITQYIDLTDTFGTGDQQFKYKKVSGQYQATFNPTNPVLSGGTNGGNITWSPFNSITATWIGQDLSAGGVPGGGKFGYTKFANLDYLPTINNTSITNLTDNTPLIWPNSGPLMQPFGPTPTLITAPLMISPTATITAATGLAPTVAAKSPLSAAPTGPGATLIPYNQWTVANGVYTLPPCPLGVTCGRIIVNEAGLLQRYVTIAGIEYIQTIVTDTNATGDPTAADFSVGSLAFKAETFVKTNSISGTTANGIANNIHIAEQDLAYKNVSPGISGSGAPLPTTGGQFQYNIALKTGWANGGPLDPKIVVDQRELVPDNNFNHTSSMENTFHMERGATRADKKIDISTVVGTINGIDGPTTTSPLTFADTTACMANFNSGVGLGFISASAVPSCTLVGTTYQLSYYVPGSGFVDPIMFNTSIVKGDFQNTVHAVTDPALLNNGGNIAWSAGDAIQATWVAGAYITSDPFGPAQISSTSYTNLSTAATTSNTFVAGPPGTTPLPIVVTGPDSWINPFTPSGGMVYSSTYVPPPF